jgi:glucuronoarabinoxylan endo-1,4-beta-xylanase
MKRTIATLMLTSAVWSSAQIATVNARTVYQPIDGFGAASAFAGPVPAPVIKTEYSSSAIGLRFIRVNLVPDYADCIALNGGGNCVKVSAGATISTADLANAQTAVANGALLWATEWSPPGPMKSNGSYLSGGSLIGNPTNYQALAAAQASFVTLMKASYSIPVYAISVQNEPNVSTKYPSCTWSSSQFEQYVPYLHRALAAAGYSDTKIMIAEPGHWNYNYMQRTMTDPAAAPMVGIVAAHAYSGGSPPTTPAFLPAEFNYTLSAGQRLWETEVSDAHDNYDGSMTNGLIYALDIHNWLTIARVNSWHYWEISGQHYTDNEGLTSQTNQFAKRAFVIGNWARFATGMSEIAATANPQTGVYVTAFVMPSTGALLIVAINTSSGPVFQKFAISGQAGPAAYSVTPYITDPNHNLGAQPPLSVTDGSFTARLTGSSVTSFVAPAIASRPSHRKR